MFSALQHRTGPDHLLASQESHIQSFLQALSLSSKGNNESTILVINFVKIEIIILEICLLTFHIWMVLSVDQHFLDNQTQFGLDQTLMRSQHSDGLPCGGEHHKQSQQLNFS